MFNIKVCCITLYREEAWVGRSVTWGRAQSHLGATRPRVGICLTRLDALASKYKTRPPLIIVLPSWGIEPQLDNADSGTRRPQVRLHCPQVGTRCPLITYLH